MHLQWTSWPIPGYQDQTVKHYRFTVIDEEMAHAVGMNFEMLVGTLDQQVPLQHLDSRAATNTFDTVCADKASAQPLDDLGCNNMCGPSVVPKLVFYRNGDTYSAVSNLININFSSVWTMAVGPSRRSSQTQALE